MFRYLIRNFNRILTLQPIAGVTTIRTIRVPSAKVPLFQIENSPNAVKKADTTEDDDIDILSSKPLDDSQNKTDYIVPYRFEDERSLPMQALIEVLRTRYRLTRVDLKRLMAHQTLTNRYRVRPLVRTMELLCDRGITKTTILENPWLLSLDRNRLEDKISLLNSMPIKDLNDFAPLLRVTLPRLRKLVRCMNREAKVVPHHNRVYYISEMLNTDPGLVIKYLSKRLFILEMPFDMLEQNLCHMINYKVSPQNILKDLWAFRYKPTAVELRLERAKRAKKEKIMPWMVRCPEPILQRSLKLTMDEFKVLGDKKSVAEYVADRLNFDIKTAETILARHTPVTRVRVTKIKEVLDYLLNEAGFTPHQIADVPRILCHSLETTKQRMQELESYGCRPTTLIILCRSKREYDKFVNSWLESRKQSPKRLQSEKDPPTNT